MASVAACAQTRCVHFQGTRRLIGFEVDGALQLCRSCANVPSGQGSR